MRSRRQPHARQARGRTTRLHAVLMLMLSTLCMLYACTVVPSCSGISGQVLMETADRFVALGLDKLGYVMPLPVLTCVRTVWRSAPFNRAHARRTNFVLRS